jgi:L-cysteine:1D-myo-inositol 2-amino-2-deoxy-alpha-D-glucopyranoside ligase
MPAAAQRLAAWQASGGTDDTAVLNDVRARLDDDLDTPGAIAVIDAAARAGRGVTSAAALVGVRLI